MSDPFTIATDGDEFEKQWWPQWIRNHFQSYESVLDSADRARPAETLLDRVTITRRTLSSGDEIRAGKRAARDRRRGDSRDDLGADDRAFARRRPGALDKLVAVGALEEDEM